MTEQKTEPPGVPAPKDQTAIPAETPAVPPAVPPAEPPAPPVPVADAVPTPPLPGTPKPPRRVLRAVARWVVAVLVMGGLGAGTLAGITAASRTDVPGLATQDDGRWDYPKLSLPALPADAPRPFNDANVPEVHHADLRQLLLPAPAGATADKKLTGSWVSTPQFVSEYAKDEQAAISQTLRDSALRHIAARGWTMPDGTSSRIYLLQFNSVAFATAFQDELLEGDFVAALTEAPESPADESWPTDTGVDYTSSLAFAEAKPYGKEQVRQGYVLAGDTLALVIHSRKGESGTERIPFHQTLILQNQLLG